MKGHAMSRVCKKKSPLEIADLMLLHNPGASMESIANVSASGVICLMTIDLAKQSTWKLPNQTVNRRQAA
jgi:hypothetical protein